MNVPKIKNILFFGIIFALSAACDFIYDDLSSCPQGTAFKFYSHTPCGDELSLENMKYLNVQVYDDKGIFITQYDKNDIIILDDYTLYIPFSTPGTFTFAFWGMENNTAYAKPDNASLQLNEDNMPVTKPLPKLYYGQMAKHLFIDRSNLGTKIDTMRINMLPYVYNINLTVKGSAINTNKKYTFEIKDNNAKYNHLGMIVPTPVLYTQTPRKEGDALKASFATLKLIRNGETTIVVKKDDGSILASYSLEKLLQGIERDNGINLNIDCLDKHNTLDILLTMDETTADGETYMKVIITINDWNFVYRTIILGA